MVVRLFYSITHCFLLSHTLSLTHSHTHIHSLGNIHTVTLTVSLSLSLSHTHTLSPEDYVHYEETVTVPGASPGNRSCFTVTVLDDDLVELTENFILSLTTADAAIRITNSATGVIYDNDGNGVCCFTRCSCEFILFSGCSVNGAGKLLSLRGVW